MPTRFPVRVLSISDQVVNRMTTSDGLGKVQDVDLILACGDLPYYYVESVMENFKAPTFFVRGNHDKSIEYGTKGPRRAPFGAFDLHKRVVNHNNLLMAGLEGSLRYKTGPFMYTQMEMWLNVIGLIPKLVWNKMVYGRYLDVLVTHSPSWGVHDGKDWAHKGFKAFRWLLKVFKPAYHFHGHIHLYEEDQRAQTFFESTKVINTYCFRHTIVHPGKVHYNAGDSKRTRPARLGSALDDFRDARRRAALQSVLATIRGKRSTLLSFEEVRESIAGEEFEDRGLQRIPLDAIAGSVGRYRDFTAKFFPRQDSDENRWVGVKRKYASVESMPPIEVYQVGEVYFVLDGNHRVSVAKQNGETHIQANVTKIESKVPLSPEDEPDDLIIKAQQVKFLKDTRLDELKPNIDFSVTAPGRFRQLRNHISAHHYLLEYQRRSPVEFEEAVVDWVEEVYAPIVGMIRKKGVLRDFPGRTPADLYVWLVNHQRELAETLGWVIEPEKVAEDFQARFGGSPARVLGRLRSKLLAKLRPTVFSPGPPPGDWRRVHAVPRTMDNLFSANLVAISATEPGWVALDQAIWIAKREGGVIRGVHVRPEGGGIKEDALEQLQQRFAETCQKAGVEGEFLIEEGQVASVLSQLSIWSDLLVVGLAHPPRDKPVARFQSGIRTLIQTCPRPVMVVPSVSNFHKGLLAYDGSLKADEALYLAAYMSRRWGIKLMVVAVGQRNKPKTDALHKAKEYLVARQVQAEYVYRMGHPGRMILKTARENECQGILMGGYGYSPIVEVVLGSTVDHVLRETDIPVLVCR